MMEAKTLDMTTKEALHFLVDELPENQAELARLLLEDLRGASDEDGEPLDETSWRHLTVDLPTSPRGT